MRMVERQREWLHVKVRARHLDKTNTAAVGSLQTQQHVSHLFIQPFLRELVRRLIVMHLMMAPASLHAMLMNTTSYFAPTPIRNVLLFLVACLSTFKSNNYIMLAC